jgi:hypothetical protein
MADTSSDRSGLLILRLWDEPRHDSRLRGRITHKLDNKATEQSVAVTDSIDAICDVVRDWVQAFADRLERNDAE